MREQYNPRSPQDDFYLINQGVVVGHLTWSTDLMAYVQESGEPISSFHGSQDECPSLVTRNNFEQYLELVDLYNA